MKKEGAASDNDAELDDLVAELDEFADVAVPAPSGEMVTVELFAH